MIAYYYSHITQFLFVTHIVGIIHAYHVLVLYKILVDIVAFFSLEGKNGMALTMTLVKSGGISYAPEVVIRISFAHYGEWQGSEKRAFIRKMNIKQV